MGHSRIAVDPHAVVDEGLGGHEVGAVHEAGIIVCGQDNAHVDAPSARCDQFRDDFIFGNVGLFDVNAGAGLANGSQLSAQDLRTAGTRVKA